MLRRRFASWVFLLVATSFLLLASCGRSGIEDLFLLGDGGLPDVTQGDVVQPDGGTCSPATCPNGCCDARGQCRTGTDTQACGSLGQSCNDCIARGFDFCDTPTRSCGRNVQSCDAKTCPDGCCQKGVDGNLVCVQGTSNTACGKSGEACNDCGSKGQTCNQQQRVCSQAACGPNNCKGCCIGDQCLGGGDGTACGLGGNQCTNCTAQGLACQGGTCRGTPTCGPQNCNGCCQGNTCVTGADNTACGSKGEACRNCVQVGQSCQNQNGANQCRPTPTCGPQTCNGCCRNNSCVSPPTNQACGLLGNACATCGANQNCIGGQCQTNPTCGPQNCNGCCIGNICAVGSQDTACGTGGGQCTNCAGQGQVCGGNGTCTQPACGPSNCAGCCAGNTCVVGFQDSACGQGGAQCTDCAANGQVCGGNRTCTTPCGPTNCQGCCANNNQCQPGFLNQQCGSGGAACVNCTQLSSQCDTLATPRVCRNQQSTCPATYPGCGAGVTTAAPADVNVCSTVELANARAACAAGANGASCDAFFQFEQTSNPQCFACLSPFKVPFSTSEFDGIFRCVAPFVSSTCNHNTGCATDCQTTSCTQCSTQAAMDQCRFDVTRGQCASAFQQVTCIQSALVGAGAFCNPGNYNFNYGAWLQGVGGHYCGP